MKNGQSWESPYRVIFKRINEDFSKLGCLREAEKSQIKYVLLTAKCLVNRVSQNFGVSILLDYCRGYPGGS